MWYELILYDSFKYIYLYYDIHHFNTGKYFLI